MKRATLALVLTAAAGCAQKAELTLAIRLPADDSGLSAVSTMTLRATRGTSVLAQSTYSASARTVSLASVSHGSDTVVSLDGSDSAGNIVARGRTCPIDFEAGGVTAPLYFAPTNFFAPTASAPATRLYPSVVALPSGDVLVAGGSDGTNVLVSSERFAPGAGTFAVTDALALDQARWHAEAIALPSIGALLVGGADQAGAAVAGGELYIPTNDKLQAIGGFDARVEHRVVLGSTPSGGARALVIGGADRLGGTPLATTQIFFVLSDGSSQVTAGPTLVHARRSHAAVASPTANDVAIVFGGYGADGQPLASIEVVTPTATSELASLTYARAEATASIIPNVGVLVVGGIGSAGTPRADAELFDFLLHTTTVYPMQSARHGHSATVLENGTVLVAGGLDADGNRLATTELFELTASFAGFVNEFDLTTARAGHAAVPLCDGTVLFVGDAAGAEVYSEAAPNP